MFRGWVVFLEWSSLRSRLIIVRNVGFEKVSCRQLGLYLKLLEGFEYLFFFVKNIGFLFICLIIKILGKYCFGGFFFMEK